MIELVLQPPPVRNHCNTTSASLISLVYALFASFSLYRHHHVLPLTTIPTSSTFTTIVSSTDYHRTTSVGPLTLAVVPQPVFADSLSLHLTVDLTFALNTTSHRTI